MAAMKTIVELFGIRINPFLAHKKLTNNIILMN